MADCSKTRILVGFTVGLSVVLIAVIVAFIYRETSRETVDTKLNAITVETFYAGYFRSPMDQRLYERRFYENFNQSRHPVNTTVDLQRGQCVFDCNTKIGLRQKRQTGAGVTHGCCYSTVVFQPVTNHTNVAGVLRTFLQYSNLKQFFAVHACSTISGCSGCTCSQESSLVMAVVLKVGVTDPDDVSDTELDYFLFDGCCTCVS